MHSLQARASQSAVPTEERPWPKASKADGHRCSVNYRTTSISPRPSRIYIRRPQLRRDPFSPLSWHSSPSSIYGLSLSAMGDFLLWTRHQLEMMSDLLGPLRLWNRPSWTIDQIPDMTGKVDHQMSPLRPNSDAWSRSF